VRLSLVNSGKPSKARTAMTSTNYATNMGFIRLQLTDPEHRRQTQRELADRARWLIAQHFPGVDVLQAPGGLVATVFNDGYTAPLVVEIEDNDLDTLRRASYDVVEVGRQVAGLRDPFMTLQTDYPELHIDTDRAAAGLVGVTARDTAQTTLEATLGNVNTPGVWIDSSNGQSYFVVTQYDAATVHDRESLAQVALRGVPGHGSIQLGTYAEVSRSSGPIAIERNHLARVATVLFQTERRDLGSAAAELESRLEADPRTAALRWRFVGQVNLMRKTFAGLGLALGLAVMVVFMILAVQFKSLRLPFAMLFTIPVAFVGVVTALLTGGEGLSITSLMGVLMVIGIAMSNGILLVDHANRVFQAGGTATAAVLDAARVRFVPILMTSLATIVGLLPTALGLDPEAAANRPLALAVVGGLLSSTVLALFLVPVMFTLLARRSPRDELGDLGAG
jgi:multidrug efflux pump subunit AcrB